MRDKKAKVLGGYNEIIFGDLSRGQVTPGEYVKKISKPRNK